MNLSTKDKNRSPAACRMKQLDPSLSHQQAEAGELGWLLFFVTYTTVKFSHQWFSSGFRGGVAISSPSFFFLRTTLKLRQLPTLAETCLHLIKPFFYLFTPNKPQQTGFFNGCFEGQHGVPPPRLVYESSGQVQEEESDHYSGSEQMVRQRVFSSVFLGFSRVFPGFSRIF